MTTPIFVMSNAELAEAIAYCSTRIGQVTTASEHYWVLTAHLKALMEAQKQRATLLLERVEQATKGVE